MVNSPFSLVVVPLEVFFIIMVTPKRGSFSLSVTFPLSVCPTARVASRRKASVRILF